MRNADKQQSQQGIKWDDLGNITQEYLKGLPHAGEKAQRCTIRTSSAFPFTGTWLKVISKLKIPPEAKEITIISPNETKPTRATLCCVKYLLSTIHCTTKLVGRWPEETLHFIASAPTLPPILLSVSKSHPSASPVFFDALPHALVAHAAVGKLEVEITSESAIALYSNLNQSNASIVHVRARINPLSFKTLLGKILYNKKVIFIDMQLLANTGTEVCFTFPKGCRRLLGLNVSDNIKISMADYANVGYKSVKEFIMHNREEFEKKCKAIQSVHTTLSKDNAPKSATRAAYIGYYRLFPAMPKIEKLYHDIEMLSAADEYKPYIQELLENTHRCITSLWNCYPLFLYGSKAEWHSGLHIHDLPPELIGCMMLYVRVADVKFDNGKAL